jgi:hypothetical protein
MNLKIIIYFNSILRYSESASKCKGEGKPNKNYIIISRYQKGSLSHDFRYQM